jgi:hypothetical protein
MLKKAGNRLLTHAARIAVSMLAIAYRSGHPGAFFSALLGERCYKFPRSLVSYVIKMTVSWADSLQFRVLFPRVLLISPVLPL